MDDQLSIRNLRCAYRVNPLGLDVARPRLSWELVSERRGVRQTAYQVVVREGDDVVWDSGRVDSDRSIQVPYDGPALRSRQRVNWQVRVWDQDGEPSLWSDRAWWEMGLLEEDDWSARWIEPDWQINTETSQPCPYLRRAWTLDEGQVAAARLYITCHGLYEASINGRLVTEDVFTPGWTSYHHRLQYQTYDVTDMLQAGENVLGVILGDGWWRGKVGVASYRNVWGTRLALLAQLEVTYADGSQVRLVSDDAWRATRGPILSSDLKDGEVYDARLEMPGWDAPGFDPEGWGGIRVAEHSLGNLVASNSVPVRRHERLRPVAILTTPAGETVADMGQNMAGRVRLRVQGPAGTTVTLTHGEALDEHGNFTMAHLQMPMAGAEVQQRVQYTLKGDGVETYEPRFTFHGFRYVKVEGWPGELTPDDLEGIAIYSAMPETGDFTCSDDRVNQLVRNTLWSMKSNFLDVPTDCPTRERAGWTGDAQIFCRPGSYLMDTAAFFCKWLADLAVEQRDDGRVTNLVPDPVKHVPPGMLTGLEGSAGWGDAAVIIPWTLYQIYGDRSILAQQYDSMRAWVEYERAHAARVHWRKKLNPAYWLSKRYRERQPFIWDTDYHWGEWLEPGGMGTLTMALGMLKRKWFGAPSVATAFFAHSARLLAQAAQVLGKEGDAATYQRLHEQVVGAWRQAFARKGGLLRPDKQATYVRALAFDLVPEGMRGAAADRLEILIREAGNHLGTGFLATPYLCQVLGEAGKLDTAYALLLQDTPPSWLYAVTKDATTIWESWEGINEQGKPSGSLNHYSYGAVVGWLFETVAGIRPGEPGFKRVVVAPKPGGGLTEANASYASVHGPIEAAWERHGRDMSLKVRIPANTTGEVHLRGAVLADVTEGSHWLKDAPGVESVKQRDDEVVAIVGSGAYHFAWQDVS